MPNFEKNPIPLKEGLNILKTVAEERLDKYGKALLLIFGDSGVGKSSLVNIVGQTKLGLPMKESPLIYPEDYHPEATRLIYHLERGEIPSGVPTLTALSRLGPGLVGKNFGVGNEVVFVEIASDKETQIANLVAREQAKAKAAGYPYHEESIAKYIMLAGPGLTTIDQRINSGVYSDVLLDASAKYRVTPEEAAKILSS